MPPIPTTFNNPEIPHNSHLKDASFSSYLRPTTTTTNPTSPKPPLDDTELSIFDAERYFNENPDKKHHPKSPVVVERCDLSSTVSRLSSVSSLDGYPRNYRTGSFHATPTASSEASWNSQTGLLSNPPGSIAVSIKTLPLKHEQRKGYSKRWLFGRKCPCSGKKSVDVEEKLPESRNPIQINSNSNGSLNPKKQSLEKAPVEMEKSLGAEPVAKLKLVGGSWAKDEEVVVREHEHFPPGTGFPAEIGRRIVPSGRSFGDSGFSFPILNPPPAAGKLRLNCTSPPEDPPRESLEVFLPSDEMGVRRSDEFQRRMVVLPFSGEAGRRSFTFSGSPKAVREDDVASDSSSDLFEIESLSTQATAPFRRRESLDEAGRFVRRSMEEGEWYEPSEASVEWSVTTAEGFDRASVANFSTSASEYEEVRFVPLTAGGGGGGGGGRKKSNGGLLSCRCEKAVNVGPQPVKCGPDQLRVCPTSSTVETARIAAMSRLTNGSSVHVPRSSDRPPLARSHSARLSRALATR